MGFAPLTVMNAKAYIFLSFTLSLTLTSCQKSSDDSSVTTQPPASSGTEDPTGSPAPVPPSNPQPNSPLPSGSWGATGIKWLVKDSFVEVLLPCSTGKIHGKIFTNQRGQFSRPGTIGFFSNELGKNITFPATFSGAVNSDKSVIALKITSDDPRIEGGIKTKDYLLKRNYNPPQWVCAF